MGLVIKIAAIGIIVAVLQQVLSRSGRDEYALLTVLAGVVVVITMLAQELSGIFDVVSSFLDF